MIQLVFRSAKYGWGGWEVQKWMFNHVWDDLLRLFVDDATFFGHNNMTGFWFGL